MDVHLTGIKDTANESLIGKLLDENYEQFLEAAEGHACPLSKHHHSAACEMTRLEFWFRLLSQARQPDSRLRDTTVRRLPRFGALESWSAPAGNNSLAPLWTESKTYDALIEQMTTLFGDVTCGEVIPGLIELTPWIIDHVTTTLLLPAGTDQVRSRSPRHASLFLFFLQTVRVSVQASLLWEQSISKLKMTKLFLEVGPNNTKVNYLEERVSDLGEKVVTARVDSHFAKEEAKRLREQLDEKQVEVTDLYNTISTANEQLKAAREAADIAGREKQDKLIRELYQRLLERNSEIVELEKKLNLVGIYTVGADTMQSMANKLGLANKTIRDLSDELDSKNAALKRRRPAIEDKTRQLREALNRDDAFDPAARFPDAAPMSLAELAAEYPGPYETRLCTAAELRPMAPAAMLAMHAAKLVPPSLGHCEKDGAVTVRQCLGKSKSPKPAKRQRKEAPPPEQVFLEDVDRLNRAVMEYRLVVFHSIVALPEKDEHGAYPDWVERAWKWYVVCPLQLNRLRKEKLVATGKLKVDPDADPLLAFVVKITAGLGLTCSCAAPSGLLWGSKEVSGIRITADEIHNVYSVIGHRDGVHCNGEPSPAVKTGAIKTVLTAWSSAQYDPNARHIGNVRWHVLSSSFWTMDAWNLLIC